MQHVILTKYSTEPKMNRGSASDYILQVQQENESLRQEIDIKV